jgi:FAD/FMN-containing dehydrogenase
MTSGLVAHPVDRARDVLRFYRDATTSLPDELTLFSGLLHAPDGSGTRLAAIIAAHAGSLAEGEAALRPIKAFGAPLMDVIGPTSYEATNTMLDAGFPRGALNYWKATFLTELSDAAIDTMVAGFQSCPSPMSGMVLEHFHGAVTRVGPTETAFPHRGEAYNLVIASEWLDPADTARNIAWTRQMYDAMRPYAARARYVNYLGDDETGNPAEAAYGPNLPRLRMIKAQYDPANVFHVNQNIQPA